MDEESINERADRDARGLVYQQIGILRTPTDPLRRNIVGHGSFDGSSACGSRFRYTQSVGQFIRDNCYRRGNRRDGRVSRFARMAT